MSFYRDNTIKNGDYIDKVAFLSVLPENSRKEIMEKSIEKKFKKGQIIFSEGESVDFITIIIDGQLKLSTYENEGRERIIGIFFDNDTIWEGILQPDSIYPYSGVCLTDVRARLVYRKDIEHAISNQSIAMSLINMLSIKLHNANQRNLILSTSDPRAKIAGFLLYREMREKSRIINCRLDDIAGSIGLRPETVSRYIQKMVKEGYIKKVSQSGIEIVDYEGLNSLIRIA